MNKYIFKHKIIFIMAILLLCLNSVGHIGIAYIVKAITDAVSLQNLELLMKTFIIASIYLILIFIVGILARVFKAKFIKLSISSLKKDVFDNILNLDIRSFNSKNSADYISVLNNDIKLITDGYFGNLMYLISNSAQLGVAILVLCFINPVLAVMTISINFIPMVIPLLLGKKLSNYKKQYSQQLSIYTEKIKDFCIGFEVIKSFNIEDEVSESHNIKNIDVEQSKYKYNILEAFSNSLSNFTSLFIFISVFVVAGYFVISDSLEVGVMLATVQLLNYVVGPIVEISEGIGRIKSVKGIKKKLLEILTVRKSDQSKVDISGFDDKIKIKDLSFGFDDEKKVIDNLSIVFEKGKKYAIVGGSGSGKSTLVKLLLKYYDNYEGEISIDNVDIHDMSYEQIYQMSSIIHQNVFMFDDTIFNNISLYKEYPEKSVRTAINKSGLESLIKELPKGIETHIQDNAKNFSGGEKQRFAIARALVKQTPILILDEATANLDNQTAYKIEESILGINDLTAIVVTHKLHSEILKRYDEIIVFKDGAISEKGTFDELMKKKEQFYSLYNVFNTPLQELMGKK